MIWWTCDVERLEIRRATCPRLGTKLPAEWWSVRRGGIGNWAIRSVPEEALSSAGAMICGHPGGDNGKN